MIGQHDAIQSHRFGLAKNVRCGNLAAAADTFRMCVQIDKHSFSPLGFFLYYTAFETKRKEASKRKPLNLLVLFLCTDQNILNEQNTLTLYMREGVSSFTKRYLIERTEKPYGK
jgi:hypothetical protein